MYEIFTPIHSVKRVFCCIFIECIRIHQWFYFNIKPTADVQVIVIPLTFSHKI